MFDPFDMAPATVYWQGRKVGRAVPQVIGLDAHPKAPPDEDDPAPAALTGIDYLQLVADADPAAPDRPAPAVRPRRQRARRGKRHDGEEEQR